VSRIKTALLALLAMGVLASLGVLAYSLVYRTKQLPLPSGALPNGLDRVRRSPTRQADDRAEAIWSGLAETLCGGPDVYELLLGAAEWGVDRGHTDSRKGLARVLAHPDKLQAVLACGKRLAKR
jgi:hypothetical protein